jgi:hypothetical protein
MPKLVVAFRNFVNEPKFEFSLMDSFYVAVVHLAVDCKRGFCNIVRVHKLVNIFCG